MYTRFGVYEYDKIDFCYWTNEDFNGRYNIYFNEREGIYIRFRVYECGREGMYVNTPGVEACVEYPRHDVRNDVVVPHFFHLRTCDWLY